METAEYSKQNGSDATYTDIQPIKEYFNRYNVPLSIKTKYNNLDSSKINFRTMEEKKPYNFQIEGRVKELKEHQGEKTICYKRRYCFGRG